MTQEEITKMVCDMLDKKVDDAARTMKTFEKCANLCNHMHEGGFDEQAKAFVELIFLNTLLHPTWTDNDHIEHFIKTYLI